MDKTIKNLVIIACIIFIAIVIAIFFLVNSNLNSDSEKNTSGEEEVDCSMDLYNCNDFSDCDAVMDIFDACMNETNEDVHGLDLDSDGIPCNSLCA